MRLLIFVEWGRSFVRSRFYFVFKLPPQWQKILGHLLLTQFRRVGLRKMLQDRLYIQPSPVSFVLGNLASYKSFILVQTSQLDLYIRV